MRPRRGAAAAACALVIALALLLARVPPGTHAATNLGGASSLIAIAEVPVRIDLIQPSLEETGVTRQRLDSLAVARLEGASIPIVRAGDDRRDALLSIQTSYLIHSGWHIVSLSLYFTRRATLASDAATTVRATVWSRDAVVIARKKKLAGEVLSALAEQIDAFAEEYRAAGRR
jgi:hypothetical protein